MKQKNMKFISVSMVALMAIGVVAPGISDINVFAEETTSEASTEDTSKVPSYQEDFFEAVNKEYLDSREMPADEVAVGVNDDLDAEVEERLKTYLHDLDEGKTQPKNNEEKQMLNYYRLTKDFDTREEQGVTPVRTYLDEIEALESSEDLTKKLPDWIEKALPLPFYVTSTPGLDDPNMNQLMIASGDLILPDTSYYDEGNKEGQELLEIYRTSSEKILTAIGYSKEDAAKHVNNAIEYDALMAKYRTPSEQRRKTSDNIIPTSKEDAHKLTESFNLIPTVEQIIGTSVEKINIDDKSYSAGLTDLMSQDNFEKLQSWMIVSEAEAAAPYMTEELRQLSEEYGMAKSGAEEAPDKEKASFEEVIWQFQDVIGNAYGEQYFGEESKKEVEAITQDVIDMYKERLKNNEWLGKETCNKAIEKLDKMGVMVGYADHYNKNTPDYVVDPEKTLYENIHSINEVDQINDLKDYGKAVAEDQWEMAPFEVNAYYNPNENLICLPAGILQEPFYSKEQSDSANYGGIGNVIGHELTHAFDPSGAEFDGDGVYKNWWTEEDYAAFEERTKVMIKQFDGIEIHGGTVNGEQTLGENVADNGGMVVALEALKTKENPNFKEFFETYAKTWAIKLRPEYAKMALTIDEHAPAEVRTNIPVQNFEEFYKAFDIKEGDKMYMKPENRIIFW